MKNLIKFTLFIYVVLLFSSCRDRIEDTYLVNEPVYMSYSELRSSFKVAGAEPIVQPGKIYFKGEYIFVNEYQKGIHIIDNSNPEEPEVLIFIEIPGNVDMAVKGNILYADSYVDLISIDISDLDAIAEVDRDTNVFPYIIPEFENGILEQVDESFGVIVGYTVTERTEKVNAENRYYTRFFGWRNEMITFDAVNSISDAPGLSGGDIGSGGSMARFTLSNDYLYVVDHSSLKLFNVSVVDNPSYERTIHIGWNIETIFPYGNKLFIGSQTGMYIYSIADPANPSYVSEFVHASACDPVVAQGDYAYVTLRGGNLCGAIESQLDVIDISVITEPRLLKSYPMSEPYGLGIDNDILFVCDGNAGLKVYNAADKLQIAANMITIYPDIHAFDVIPLGDILIMIGIGGLYQYNYSDPENILLLSHIPIYGLN